PSFRPLDSNVCPPAADMLVSPLQIAFGPGPRQSQRRARPPPFVSRWLLHGAERLSGKTEASAGLRLQQDKAAPSTRNAQPMAGRQTASKTEKSPVEIKLAHSPDSDDAFMFYALATHKLATPGYKYTHVPSAIQSLNEAALTETYDVTAISFAAYPTLRDKYILLDCGASFGEGYGPIVVASKPLRREELARKRIAVPGLKTTAYLTLKLFQPDFEAVVMPFDKIIDAVKADSVDAGLLIHEG